MKRIICILSAAAIMMLSSVSVFADTSTITVKNNIPTSKAVTYTYNPEEEADAVKSIKPLMTKSANLTRSNLLTQTLTISKSGAAGETVGFMLRLSLQEKKQTNGKTLPTPSPSEYDALYYYNIKVTSENGKVVYNSEEENASTVENATTYRDIPLGTLGADKSDESQTYNVVLSINKNLDKPLTANAAKNMDWSIVAYTPTPTDDDATNISASEPPTETTPPSAMPSALPQTTPVPSAKVKSDKNGSYSLPQGSYEIGVDIDADKYIIKGSGHVNIYGSDGKLERTIVLKSRNDKTSSGVSEYVADLRKGEKIEVENEATLDLYTAPTASPASTATAKPASPSSSPAAQKNNPKTGDTFPFVPLVGLGTAALIVVFGLALLKKNR